MLPGVARFSQKTFWGQVPRHSTAQKLVKEQHCRLSHLLSSGVALGTLLLGDTISTMLCFIYFSVTG